MNFPTKEEYKQQNPKKKKRKNISINIPTTVISLDEKCFNNYEDNLQELTIPTTVKSIPKRCMEKCFKLTNISLPLNENQIIISNKIFNNTQKFEQD